MLKLGAAPLHVGARTCSSCSGSTREPRDAAGRGRDGGGRARRATRRAADDVVRATGLDARAVAVALAELELAGLACEGDGLYRAASPEPDSGVASARVQSWWLTEEAAPDFGSRRGRAARRRDRRRRHHGHLRCADARRSGEARSRARRAPRRRGRERTQRRLRAARRRDAVRPRARHRSAPSARAELLAADGGAPRPARAARAATRSAGPAASVSPRTTRNATRSAPSSRRCGEDGFDGGVAIPTPLRGRFPAAIFHPGDAATQPARLVRRLAMLAAEAGVAFVENHRVESLDELDAEQVLVATDGYPSGLLGRSRGDRPDARAGDRDGADRRAPVRVPALRAATASITGSRRPTAGSSPAASATSRSTSEFTDDEETTAGDPGRARGVRRSSSSGEPVAITHRWAGIFGLVPDFLPLVGRVPGRDARGSPAATRATATCSASSAASSSRGAMLGDEHPLLGRFDRGRRPAPRRTPFELRRASRARARQVELVGALQRREGDREILDREAGRVEDRDLVVRCAGPRAVPASTSPSCVTSSRVTRPASTACARSPLWDACSQSSQKTRTRASSSTAISALPGPSAPIRLTCWPGRSEPRAKTISRRA